MAGMTTTSRLGSIPGPALPPPGPVPGPPGHWLLGHLGGFSASRLDFLVENAKTYGDLYALRFAHRRLLVVNHPDLIEEVLVTRNRQYIKHFALRKTKGMLGEGLLTSEGDFWRRQRRLAQPAFHRDKIAALAGLMVDCTERMLQTWSAGQHRDMRDDMTQLTLEIVALCLFGADVSAESAAAGRAMDELLTDFTRHSLKLVRLPEWVPTGPNRRLRRARNHLNQLLGGIIARRRASGEDRGDLLSMLLRATDDEGDGDGKGEAMSDAQLRSEVMTLFAAGHETTANTLAWAWFLLARNPEAEAYLHAEVDAVLGDRPPTFADLPHLRAAEHVINETLRLYPTVWLLGREAIEPTEVGGHPVPVGTTIYMSEWVVHRDERFWPNPLRFDPTRWADDPTRKLPRYAFFPFGGGPRICIGNNFAMMEATLILAAIARRFRVRVAPEAVVTPIPTLTLRLDPGVPVVLESRRPV